MYISVPLAYYAMILLETSNGQFLCRSPRQMNTERLGEKVFATPAVVDNKLYVRTVMHMYAFGE
jgi:hypothetical protein